MSLNHLKVKHELNRINNENEKLAKKLISWFYSFIYS